jgi:hypothetical protein
VYRALIPAGFMPATVAGNGSGWLVWCSAQIDHSGSSQRDASLGGGTLEKVHSCPFAASATPFIPSPAMGPLHWNVVDTIASLAPSTAPFRPAARLRPPVRAPPRSV